MWTLVLVLGWWGPAWCPDIVEGQPPQLDVQMPFGGWASTEGGEYDFRLLPTKAGGEKRDTDTVWLRNGDKVSGEIQRISGGVAVLRSELLPEAMRIPLANMLRLLLKDRQGSIFKGGATVFLVNGDHLSVNLQALDEQEALAEVVFHDEVRIRREHLSGIVFLREPRLIYETDFASGDACGFESADHTWTVADGALRPSNSSRRVRGAYLRLPQEGHLKYSWRVSVEGRRSLHAALYVFAGAPDPYQPGNAYHVLVSGTGVNLYRTIRDNSQHMASSMLSSNKNSRLMELDYDSRSGIARVSVDGKEVIVGQFGSPLTSGEYLIAFSNARDSFEHIAVRQVTGPLVSSRGEKVEQEDCVFLMRGDRLSGKVTRVSDGKVRIETVYSAEPLEVPLEEISSVRFSRVEESAKTGLSRICLRNGDEMSGVVTRLEEGQFQVSSPLLGDQRMDSADVRDVLFPGGRDGLGVEGGEGMETVLPEVWHGQLIRSGRPLPIVIQ